MERERAVRHTRRVKQLRVALPAIAAVVVVGLVGAAALPKLLPLSLAGLSLSAEGLVMNAPRLSGHLGEGRRYEVTAERAIQSLINPQQLTLRGLSATIDLAEDGRIDIAGDSAAYNTQTEILSLSDGVTLKATDGTSAQLPGATLDLARGTLKSDGAVSIATPRGTIRAGGLSVAGGGNVIRFTDGIALTINP